MSMAASVSRMVSRNGMPFTLRRDVVTAPPNAWTQGNTHTIAYYPCMARERGNDTRDLRGALQENESRLTVDAATLSVAPTGGDRFAAGTLTADGSAAWKTVVNVYAAYEGPNVRTYVLTLRR